MKIEVSERWQRGFLGGQVGVLLVSGVDNSQQSLDLQARKRALETRLREQYGHWNRAQLLELEVLKAYRNYYKQFDKTYHVQLQLESILHKGKSLPDVSPLVDANFMAELETLVLTAGHDANLLQGSVCLDMTQGGEAFTQINGTIQTLKPRDMMMTDQSGIVCTILYGQDQRTPITPQTRRALFVAYAPAGVPTTAVQAQLESIREHLFCFAPESTIEQLEIFKAGVNDD